MATSWNRCDICGRRFEPKFSFQVQRSQTGLLYLCTQTCMLKSRMQGQGQSFAPESSLGGSHREQNSDWVECATCTTKFQIKYTFQQMNLGQKTSFFCSMQCRSPSVLSLETRRNRVRQGPRKIAILNQKGGTGKTTTTVNLAAGLAQSGQKTLVMDMDAQGHIGVSLGIKADKSLYHLLVENASPQSCAIEARPNLEVIASNESLASAEISLARMNEGREWILRSRMRQIHGYDFIILDCGPSLSLLNMNALTYADHIIIPVSCDFLSLVGVKQILRTLKNVNHYLLHPISILGILPTFYDRRNKISHEAVNTLKGYFKDKVLPPIRVNTRLREAPSHKETIFEYAPHSNGARDYRKLVDWVIAQTRTRRDVA